MAIKELVRYCGTLPRLLDGEAFELDFTRNGFPAAFARRIIEVSAQKSQTSTTHEGRAHLLNASRCSEMHFSFGVLSIHRKLL